MPKENVLIKQVVENYTFFLKNAFLIFFLPTNFLCNYTLQLVFLSKEFFFFFRLEIPKHDFLSISSNHWRFPYLAAY